MVEAFTLIQTDVGGAEVAAKQLTEIAGVPPYVTDPYDDVGHDGR